MEGFFSGISERRNVPYVPKKANDVRMFKQDAVGRGDLKMREVRLMRKKANEEGWRNSESRKTTMTPIGARSRRRGPRGAVHCQPKIG